MKEWCEMGWRKLINNWRSLGAYGYVLRWLEWRSRSASEQYLITSQMTERWCSRIADRPPR